MEKARFLEETKLLHLGPKCVIFMLTNFKTSINESNQRARNVKTSLNLCDRALHVAALKCFGKEHKTHGSQKHLKKTHTYTQTHTQTNTRLTSHVTKTHYEFIH